MALSEIQDTDSGRELIASMQEAAAIVQGEKEAARVHLSAGDVDVRAIRGSQRCAIGAGVCDGPIRPHACSC